MTLMHFDRQHSFGIAKMFQNMTIWKLLYSYNIWKSIIPYVDNYINHITDVANVKWSSEEEEKNPIATFYV